MDDSKAAFLASLYAGEKCHQYGINYPHEYHCFARYNGTASRDKCYRWQEFYDWATKKSGDNPNEL